MIKVVIIKGGLGNQMFQYAFYLSLRKRHPFSFYLFFLEDDALYTHSGYQMDKIFNIHVLRRDRLSRFFKNKFPRVLRFSGRIEEKKCFKYDDECFRSSNIISIYDGYWQTEKYFSIVSDKIRKRFCFRMRLLNEETKQLASLMQKREYVSVHIRRGDYLTQTDCFLVCDLSYYREAMACIRAKVDNPKFVFFSDDIAWVRENLYVEDSIYVSWNSGKDSWQDMYLMSQCKHNIIANSTFSWWGAWLNSNPQKIVVAPKQWLSPMPPYDVLPDTWESI